MYCGSGRVIKRGYFKLKWNYRRVPRYRCHGCGRHFSASSYRLTYRQKKPYLNRQLFALYGSGLTQRRLAKVLGVTRQTIERKFLFLSRLSRMAHEGELRRRPPPARVHFDEMESFEHTRLKPLSIALAVEESTGHIIDVKVASKPASGKLKWLSRRKYGYRKDERQKARTAVLATLARLTAEPVIVTDLHPAYPRLIEKRLPRARHLAVKTKKGFKPGYRRRNEHDPLWRLNHTAALFRHDLSRLGRKVWTTTKKPARLQCHLDLYLAYRNRYALPRFRSPPLNTV